MPDYRRIKRAADRPFTAQVRKLQETRLAYCGRMMTPAAIVRYQHTSRTPRPTSREAVAALVSRFRRGTSAGGSEGRLTSGNDQTQAINACTVCHAMSRNERRLEIIKHPGYDRVVPSLTLLVCLMRHYGVDVPASLTEQRREQGNRANNGRALLACPVA